MSREALWRGLVSPSNELLRGCVVLDGFVCRTYEAVLYFCPDHFDSIPFAQLPQLERWFCHTAQRALLPNDVTCCPEYRPCQVCGEFLVYFVPGCSCECGQLFAISELEDCELEDSEIEDAAVESQEPLEQ